MFVFVFLSEMEHRDQSKFSSRLFGICFLFVEISGGNLDLGILGWLFGFCVLLGIHCGFGHLGFGGFWNLVVGFVCD